jgi:hypothetical protein
MKVTDRLLSLFSVLAAALCLMAPTASLGSDAGPVATLVAEGTTLILEPHVEAAGLVLSLGLPDGSVVRHELPGGGRVALDLQAAGSATLPEGVYRYELIAAPRLEAGVREALAAAREAGDDAAQRLQGLLPDGPRVQSGSFRVRDGRVQLAGTEIEPAAGVGADDRDAPTRDQVIPDDLIVQGSLCVGFDCVNNESFGSDTIRLKQNNLRIKFEDTSDPTSQFPSTDWQLTANDSVSGGLNRFSIEDITDATVPFTIVGGATTNSVYVASTGRVGFRTSTPVLDLHVATGNTPAMRLEQNNSSGFTAQTWDIAGNEANFFVRDFTGGSRLPLRIRPGAPTSSLDISATGNVGFGTASPAAALDVRRNGVTDAWLTTFADGAFPSAVLRRARGTSVEPTALVLDDRLGSVGFRGHDGTGFTEDRAYIAAFAEQSFAETAHGTRLELYTTASDSAEAGKRLTVTGAGDLELNSTLGTWSLAVTDPGFALKKMGAAIQALLLRNDGGVEITDGTSTIFTLWPSGNLEISGALTQSSDVARKEGFRAVDGQEVLARLAQVPIHEWSYKHDGPGVRHVGPTAQDFRAAFGLGADEKHIAVLDSAGVSMAAIQALYAMLQEKDAALGRLEAQNAELESRLAALEKLVRDQASAGTATSGP